MLHKWFPLARIVLLTVILHPAVGSRTGNAAISTAQDLQSRIVDRAYAVSLHSGDRHLETPPDGAGSHSESTRFSPISAAGGAGHLYRADESARCAGSTAFDLPAGAPFSPKYCQTRKRFFQQFFFDGAIAEGINGTTVNFGDQTVYMGFALATFAGEAKILAEADLDTRPSELAIARILAEYDLLDTEAEQVAYGTAEPGFFLRDYVIPPGRPGTRPDFSKLGFGEGFVVQSDFGNDAAPGDKDMSQDQALHMLVGLWAVKQWAPDQHFDNRSLAEQHTQRLIDFLKRERFLITRPESDDPVDRGADAQSLAGFMLQIAGQTLNQDQSSGAEVRFFVPLIGTLILPLDVVHGAVVDELNAQQSLEGIEIGVAGITLPIEPSSFWYNLLLLGAAYEAGVTAETFDRIAEECSDPALGGYGHIWAKDLRALVQSSSVADVVIVQANTWHDLAPLNGPVGDLAGNPVWFKDNRWIRCGETNDAPGWIWNGLDFLSLDVLMHMQPQNGLAEVYVAKPGQAIEIGTPALPYDTVQEGVQGVVRSGKRVLRIRGGDYPEALTINGDPDLAHPMVLKSDGGGAVVIGR